MARVCDHTSELLCLWSISPDSTGHGSDLPNSRQMDDPPDHPLDKAWSCYDGGSDTNEKSELHGGEAVFEVPRNFEYHFVLIVF